ncbi:MAG TPA: sigma-70 family RNA polymerase sigma factor, partial [Candidatus Blautia merdavium]|nr:sigma-70 family RNA polymerase sigma factor [Candidatus Blautia merdavium]
MAKDDLIKRMMEKLNERQRDIVYLFYFEQWRQQDIADHFGVSQQSVSDMIRRVLKILSEYVHQERNN